MQGSIPIISLPQPSILAASLKDPSFANAFLNPVASGFVTSALVINDTLAAATNNTLILVRSTPSIQLITPPITPSSLLLALIHASSTNLSLSEAALSTLLGSTRTSLRALSDSLDAKEDKYSSFYTSPKTLRRFPNELVMQAVNKLPFSSGIVLDIFTEVTNLLYAADAAQSWSSKSLSSDQVLAPYGVDSSM